MAYTEWKNCRTATGMSADGAGTAVWYYETRTTTCNGDATKDHSANTTPNNGKVSNYLKCTNFGFSIPSDANVTGVEVRIQRKTGGTTKYCIKDNLLKLHYGTSVMGYNKAITTSYWSYNYASVTYGSSTDGWGVSLTPSIINNSTFGVQFQVKNLHSSVEPSAFVDCISIRVHYITQYRFSSTANLTMVPYSNPFFISNNAVKIDLIGSPRLKLVLENILGESSPLLNESPSLILSCNDATIESYNGYIGPIKLSNVHLKDGLGASIKDNLLSSSFRGSNVSGKRNEAVTENSFKLLMPPGSDLQLMGLVDLNEFVPVNTNIHLPENQGLSQKGYAHITGVRSGYLTPNHTETSLELSYITKNLKPNLIFDYTTGIMDGTKFNIDYAPVDLEDIISIEQWDHETFTDEFYSPRIYGLRKDLKNTWTDEYMSIDARVSSAGNYGYLSYTRNKDLSLPIYVEAEMYRENSLPTNSVGTGFMIGNRDFSSGEVEGMAQLRCRLVHDMKTHLVVDLYRSGKYITLIDVNVNLPINNHCKLKAYIDEEANITVWYSINGDYIKVLDNVQTRADFKEKAFVSLYCDSTNDTPYNMGYTKFNIWNMQYRDQKTSAPRNVICAPPTKFISPKPDFERRSTYGCIPCYVNPQREINFTIDPLNFYDGSVKVWDGTNHILNRDHVFKNVLTLENGVTRLDIDLISNTISFYGFYSAWEKINVFSIGELYEASIHNLSSEEVTIKVNNTYWNLKRGKPSLVVIHPQSIIEYMPKECYYHDDTDKIASAERITGKSKDIAMKKLFYCNVYDEFSDFGMQILKNNPTIIKNDFIPPDSFTGIGWYYENETEDDNKVLRAKEWLIQPDTKINY
jgi:hypothetical protein